MIILFLIGVLIIPVIKLGSSSYLQYKFDSYFEKANYPEIKGRKPTFTVDIKTTNSTTHVYSFLPATILQKKNFDEMAASEVTSYVEKFAEKEQVFTFNPFAKDGFDVRARLTPRHSPPSENFVFLISDSDPIPGILEKNKEEYQVLYNSFKKRDTVFFTEPIDTGSVSFMHFTEGDTWSRGFPVDSSRPLSIIEQLNLGFNIEIWKRSVIINPDYANNLLKDHKPNLFIVKESLWNTFGRLVFAKQENTPYADIQARLEKNLNRDLNIAHYPFDEISQKLYELAPLNPIIQ